MSGLFNSYEEDFNDTVRGLREGCSKLQADVEAQSAHEKDPTRIYHPPPATGPLSRAQQLQVVQQSLSHAKDLVTSMMYEMTDVEPSHRAATKEKVEAFRRTCNSLDHEVTQLRQSCSAADRADLLRFGSSTATGGTGDSFMMEADADTQAHRLLALQTTEKLQGGTNTLRKAEAYLAQTNSLGHESLGTLRRQTEQIAHVHETTHDVDAEISRARVLINQMQRTAIRHKVWLIGIIFLLVSLVVLLLYLRR
ncbi:Vesicle transport v-SNARE protein N-terminus, putative [Leishmania lindenbergi]|uniref:Vesicle transport v-SNARE protein N-terminus n=1 Tax=Leishmania lindenbergi TaxID=651832 RepID=A0AAW3AF15_9TRYP